MAEPQVEALNELAKTAFLAIPDNFGKILEYVVHSPACLLVLSCFMVMSAALALKQIVRSLSC